MREAAAQREREQRIAQEGAAKDCDMIWIFASTTGVNSYLASKGLPRPISDYGLRRAKEPFGDYSPFDSSECALVVPVVDIVGAVRSLQFIAPDGEKRFYPSGKLRGHFCPIALTENPIKVLICEGIATALTLNGDSGLPVITAFNAGNLPAVAEAIRWKYPKAEILICGDDDHLTEGNPGATKAAEAAGRCGGDWVLPVFTGLPRGLKDTDFNDLQQLKRCAA